MIDPYRVVFLVALVGVLSVSVAVGTVGAQTAPDCSTVTYNGDGTEANPYEVGNVDQLQCINEQGLDAKYRQVSDIDASGTSEWNGGKGFEPIGDFNNRFTGTFDGADYTISELTIDRGSTDLVGLFGFVDSGRLKNASLNNVDVSGNNRVGGLVGGNDGNVRKSYATGDVSGNNGVGGLVGRNEDVATVKKSYATGSVDGGNTAGGLIGANSGTIEKSNASGLVNGTFEVGGLVGDNRVVGDNRGTISESHATVSVDGSLNSVGGLVGQNIGTIFESYATGSVDGSTNSVGGLVGDNNVNGTISGSYATGSVDGDLSVGGLVGFNSNTVRDSYATGEVNGDTNVGGLVGDNARGTIDGSYATGEVNGNTGVGGLVGDNEFLGSEGTVIDSYWDTETTGQSTSAGNGTGLTTSEMTGAAATNNMQGFDFTSTWETVTNPDDYPILVWQTDSGNIAPTADFTFSPTSPETGETVTFDASGSIDDGSIESYDWDFDGDGTTDETTTSPTTTHTYTNAGTFDASVTVTDDGGRTDTTTQTVTVEQDGGGGDDPTEQEVIDAVRSAGDNPNEIERDSIQNAIFEFVTSDNPTFNGVELTREGLQGAVFNFVTG